MKICLVSFDFWDYDQHIVDVLKKKGVEAHHIKLSTYGHPNFGARLKNTFSKIFLKKNIKNENRQKMILETLKKLGKQDQILVINPEFIEERYHAEIKKFTKKYIAYLYDALARNPAEKVLPYFDEVFSFDKNDIQKHGFKETTNYNYLPHKKFRNQENKFDLIYVGSFDERIAMLYEIAKKMENFGKKYHFLIVGKKAWKKRLEQNKNFSFTRKRISHADLPKVYEASKIVLDLVREHQSGLSFRIFEAMALEKKIITTNPFVKNYDFYNPNNILILKDDLSNLDKSFFETDYQELSPKIYNKYTLENWVETVFNLKQ